MTNCRLRVAEALPSGQDNSTRPRLRLGVFGDDILIDFRQYFGDRNGRLLLVAGMTDRKREKEILVEFETQVKGRQHVAGRVVAHFRLEFRGTDMLPSLIEETSLSILVQPSVDKTVHSIKEVYNPVFR
ncbi:hypothetical protein Bbelb_144750 [Branchiostoma belcheri]|nr:hypothetical protein Bbelb_144750 [Branchiostoma belcheri]